MKAEELKGLAEKSKAKKLEQAIEEIESRIIRNNEHGINCFKITTDKYSDDFYKIDKWMVKPIIEHFRSNGFKVEVKETYSNDMRAGLVVSTSPDSVDIDALSTKTTTMPIMISGRPESIVGIMLSYRTVPLTMTPS